MVQISQADVDDEGAPDDLADTFMDDEDVREYLAGLPPVALSEFDAAKLFTDVERDISILDDLAERRLP